MKHNQWTRMGKVRHALAGIIACVVVLGVPVLSLNQLWHPHSSAHRPATPLPALQVRPIDQTTVAPQIFRQPLISITFDDGYESSYQEAFPILQKHGIRTTQYILSGVESDPQYLSWDQIKAIQKAGHEIGCHSVNHPDLTLLTDTEVMSQLNDCRTTMQKYFGNVTDFASPYGAQNARTLADIKKVFASQRNVYGDSSNGVTSADVNTAAYFDPNNIIGMTVKHDTTLAEIQTLINFTVQNNGWLVLTYHQADDGPSKYALDRGKLDDQMNLIQHVPVRVVTVHEAISSWQKERH